MSLPTKCMGCGAEPGVVAQVMDPFMDSCYALCRDCLAPLHTKIGIQIRDTFAARGGVSPSADEPGETPCG